ncbi:GNAT family N-acetyltransferase [Variovorax sp. J22R133]|uniref:GNAT family N-acetyltransferase n=1 Tax=Variovorax brevis TaxID=3053503 RepID=UPI0025773423|nr:GNAT family N-acetyltransferase [Variovorax sp. J22R133]MDM0115606.1 GNAT family N-acetyltransferase [Variovorax sp. J22R133]
MSFSVSRPLPLAEAPNVAIVTPDEAHELRATRAIFEDYAHSLNVDLCFQHFEEELASLPGDYAEPRGALVLALMDSSQVPAGIPDDPRVLLQRGGGRTSHVMGCCALRPLDSADYPNAAEMKRLYVRPAYRSMGLGRQLVEAVLDAARSAGYACVLLDTLDDMEAARTLYEELGFEEVPPYYHNPIAGSHYLKVEL